MKIKTENIIQSKVFAEVCQPKKIVDIPELESYLIYHTHSLSKPGTNLWKTKRMLSLYKKDELKFKNHITIRYPINNSVYDVQNNSLFLATGQYDGGHSYNGELLKWELIDNNVYKIVEDNREFRNVQLLDNHIFVDVLPTDDQTEDQTIKRYQLQKDSIEINLLESQFAVIDETSEDNHTLDTNGNIEKTFNKLHKIARSVDANYNHKYSANCIKIIEENHIAVGFNDSSFSIINTMDLKEECGTIKEKANCYQIFKYVNDSLIFNFFPIWPPENYVYQYSNRNLQHIPNITGLLYSNKENFFAKQIEQYPFEKNLTDVHLNNKLKILNTFRIGNYNGYQHHLNANSNSAFYFFQGISDSNYSKTIVEYSIEKLRLTKLYEFKENEKYVNTNGVIINKYLIISCTKAFGTRSNLLLRFNLEEKTLSEICELESQIVQIMKIGDDAILFLDIDGKIGIIDLAKIKTTYLNVNLKVKNQTPISFDLNENTLVIGYNSGTIEILSIE